MAGDSIRRHERYPAWLLAARARQDMADRTRIARTRDTVLADAASRHYRTSSRPAPMSICRACA